MGAGIGVDLDARLIETACQKNRHPHVQYLHADARTGLQFPDASFDIITAFGVLEHVGPEESYAKEFFRLLRPDGLLIVDVPSMGLFRSLDIGNIKYNYPRLHRWYYCSVLGKSDYYEEHFGSSAAMFGQFSREATQHKHYSAKQITQALQPWFVLSGHFKYGFFFEAIQLAGVLAKRPFGDRSRKIFDWLLHQDCKIVSPLGMANIVATFKPTVKTG